MPIYCHAYQKKSDGKVLNIAGGKRISINDLANKIMNMIGREVQVVYKERREGDVKDSLADISLARDFIDYTPKYSLDEGLKETIHYFKEIY